MTTIGATAFTDRGLVRTRNEDAVLVNGWLCQAPAGSVVSMTFSSDTPFVCAVADGMGGHAGGDLASRVALGVIADAAPTWGAPEDVSTALGAANDRVLQVGQNPDLHGLGTTVAGLCVLPTEVVVFNVGDSRVYNVKDGFVQQVSVDDAVTDGDGRPTGVITRSLGQRGPFEPHVAVQPRDGSTYLICSDGIHGTVSAAGLRAGALKPDPVEFAQSIIASARDNGAADNLSLILVSIPAVTVDVPVPEATPRCDTTAAANVNYPAPSGAADEMV